jgi:hypothetical protein
MSNTNNKAPTVLELKKRVDNLESLISKLAVMTGQGNMLLEFGVKRWEPGKKDMSKYRS